MRYPEDILAGKIVNAFKKARRPKDIVELWGSDGTHVESYWRNRERYSIKQDSIKPPYEGSSIASLITHLTPSAYRHFLPSYMLVALGPRKETGPYDDITATTIDTLTPPWVERKPPSQYDVAKFGERFGTFSKEQNEATAAFLKYTSIRVGCIYEPRNQSRLALKHYWRQFL
jgi:hypothetical protein